MPARLRTVPERPLRALGMVRVSKERDGMMAPEVQRVAIADYAASRGYEVTGWLEGLDESGSRAKSAWWPRLDQAVSEVESGQYDVILVWKFSRTARHRLRWAVAIDRVEEAGGRLESATEQVDTTTSTGRFTRGMLAELNAFEAERIGEVWKEVHARRIASGRPASGKPKWGYAYDRVAKLHVPDPVTGPVLADLYRRYVAGESFYALVRWLNAHGHRTLLDGPWNDRTLRRVMDSGFATGRLPSGGDLLPGAHEALIDDKVWQAYLDARHVRRARPARSERSQYLLSGMVTCARCKSPMVAGQFGNAREPKYRCKRGKEMGPTECVGGYVMAKFVEREVYEWLQRVAGDVDVRREALAATRVQRTTVRHDRDRIARQVARTEATLSRLIMQDAEQPMPPAIYRANRSELEGQLAELDAALQELERQERAVPPNPAAAAKALLATWKTRPVEHKRETLRRLVGRIEVVTGRPRGTVDIKGVWEL